MALLILPLALASGFEDKEFLGFSPIFLLNENLFKWG
jgi:hypothetical protein